MTKDQQIKGLKQLIKDIKRCALKIGYFDQKKENPLDNDHFVFEVSEVWQRILRESK